MVDVGDIYTGRDEEWKKDDCGAGCLVISGMMRGSSTRGGLYIYLAVLSTSAVVLVEHRLASVGPQLQASRMHPGLRDGRLSISQFGTIWSNPSRCTFTDCGLVNLVWALAQTGSGPVRDGQAGS